MKVLLDECVPKGVKRFLAAHQVFTTQELKWGGIQNGKLLSAAEKEGFDVLVTCDKNLPYQQRITGRAISIVQLPTNNLSGLKTIADRISQAVDSALPGTFVSIDF
jgi:predicted nuclease of predicted toxin-antitoxin system